MSLDLGSILIASVFTLGCMGIHGARRRANLVTSFMVIVAVTLVAAIAIVATPAVVDPDGAAAFAATIDPAFGILQPE